MRHISHAVLFLGTDCTTSSRTPTTIPSSPPIVASPSPFLDGPQSHHTLHKIRPSFMHVQHSHHPHPSIPARFVISLSSCVSTSLSPEFQLRFRQPTRKRKKALCWQKARSPTLSSRGWYVVCGSLVVWECVLIVRRRMGCCLFSRFFDLWEGKYPGLVMRPRRRQPWNLPHCAITDVSRSQISRRVAPRTV